jgi:replicative DNA helicase
MSNQQQQAKAPNLNVESGAPFSQEAEEAVIGSILIEPSIFTSISSFLHYSDFFLLRHQYIWQAMERINARHDPIDPIILAEELENANHLDTIGGRAYIIQTVNNSGTSMYAEVYGQLVKKTSVRRKLMAIADEIKKQASDESLASEIVLSNAESSIIKVSSESASNDNMRPIWDIASGYYDGMERRLQERQGNQESLMGVPSGLRDVDMLLGGWRDGELIIIGGRPGTGKSAWLICNVLNAAMQGHRVVVFTLEMETDQYFERMLSMLSGVSVQKIVSVNLTHQEASRITHTIGVLSNLHIWIDDTSKVKQSQIRSKAQRIRYEYGIDLLVVDYIQLMDGSDAGAQTNRHQQVGFTSRSLKSIAKDLKVPVLTAAQLSRDLESRGDKRPMLSDLKESGDLEQDADKVLFLYRDELYNENTEFPNQADLIVAKHRNGPTGTVSLYFEKSLTKFMDASVHRVDLSGLE